MAQEAKSSRRRAPTRGSKPGERRGGRAKGTPNKLTGDVRAMILSALQEAGGDKYLVQQALANPALFLPLLGKLLPKEVTGADGKDLFPTRIKVELVGG